MPRITPGVAYQIKLIGSFGGQETVNVFHYGADAYVGDAATLLTAWWGVMRVPLTNTVTGEARFDTAEVQQEVGGALFGSKSLAESGNVAGDALPPFVSWDFTLLRGGALERNGYKRFAGVPESKQVGGIAEITFLSTLQLLSDAIFGGFDIILDHFTPLIKRNHVNHIHVVPAQYWSISQVVYSKIGSQNSRKFGHGR